MRRKILKARAEARTKREPKNNNRKMNIFDFVLSVAVYCEGVRTTANLFAWRGRLSTNKKQMPFWYLFFILPEMDEPEQRHE